MKEKYKNITARVLSGILAAALAGLVLTGCGQADVSLVEAATGGAAYTGGRNFGPGETAGGAEASPSGAEIVIVNETERFQEPSGTVYTTDRVRLRAAASTESEIITVLEPGEALELYGMVNAEWARVRFQGREAFIAGAYISGQKPAAPTEAERPTVPVKTETETAPAAQSKTQGAAGAKDLRSKYGYADGEAVSLDPGWKYADFSAIHTGSAVMYLAGGNRKNIVVGVNAGHGTKGGGSVKTWCHPDKSPKFTGGTTAAGATKATAVSSGMNFSDGTAEHTVTLRMARLLRDRLLENGYDVLMIRDGEDVQLDNVARTVICNHAADCHIALHWDSDGLSYDKGCFFMSVPNGLKSIEPAASVWQQDNALGDALIAGLKAQGLKIFDNGRMDMDLTQTSFSSVPSVDIELGNQRSDHGDAALAVRAEGLLKGVEIFFGQ